MPLVITLNHYRGETNDWSINTTFPASIIKASGATSVSATYDNRAVIYVNGTSIIAWGFGAEYSQNEKVSYDFSKLKDTDIIMLESVKTGTVGGTGATFTFRK